MNIIVHQISPNHLTKNQSIEKPKNNDNYWENKKEIKKSKKMHWKSREEGKNKREDRDNREGEEAKEEAVIGIEEKNIKNIQIEFNSRKGLKKNQKWFYPHKSINSNSKKY